MKRYRYWWIWILVCLYIYMIFRNSMMVAELSSKMSSGVTVWILNHISKFGLYASDFYTVHHYVRKLAHFTEFAGLGCLVSLAMHICPLMPSRFLNFVLFLIAIPAGDEVIQHFTEGRSMQFSDMAIDGSGFLFGAFLCYVLILVVLDITGNIQRGKKKTG
ncbi:MAG: VanZ family protein [Solobacterium sp.]|nr:VanZ family protein [Solobacterium sp.]